MSRLSGKNVLVLGGAGFIGSNLVNSLHNANLASLTVADNFFLGNEVNFSGPHVLGGELEVFRIDASDFSSLLRLVQSREIDRIFNLAVVPLPTSLEFPSWTISTNIAVTTNCCELVRGGFVERLVQLSSSEVYGSASVVPMDESHPFNPSTPYAASKSASDQVVLSYVHTFGIDAQILRPFSNYGPRQNSGTYAGIFPILIRHAMNGTEVGIFGDGNQTRDYVFVQDSVRQIIELAQISDRFEKPVNVATGFETSVNDLVSLVGEAMNCHKKSSLATEARGCFEALRRHLTSYISNWIRPTSNGCFTTTENDRVVFGLMEKIEQKEPDLGLRENRAATNVLLPGALTAGPKTKEFDQTFGLKVGSNRLCLRQPRKCSWRGSFRQPCLMT